MTPPDLDVQQNLGDIVLEVGTCQNRVPTSEQQNMWVRCYDKLNTVLPDAPSDRLVPDVEKQRRLARETKRPRDLPFSHAGTNSSEGSYPHETRRIGGDGDT